MFKTVFDKDAKHAVKGGLRWGLFIVLVSVLMVVVALIRVTLKLPPAVYTPSFLVVFLLMLVARKGNSETITFHVQKDDKNNFRYGYMNLDGEVKQFPIDEYSYWYVNGNTEGHYELYMELISGGQTVYLRDKVSGANPPHGWTKSDIRINFVPGNFDVPGLEELAYRIDQGSA